MSVFQAVCIYVVCKDRDVWSEAKGGNVVRKSKKKMRRKNKKAKEGLSGKVREGTVDREIKVITA